MNRKGQISFGLISAGVSVMLASIGAFFYQTNRIGAVETRAAVLEERYEQIDRKLERIINNLEGIKAPIRFNTTSTKQ